MPPEPHGDQPMTDAERQRKRRDRLRQERGITEQTPAALIDALRNENAALRRQLAAAYADVIEARQEAAGAAQATG